MKKMILGKWILLLQADEASLKLCFRYQILANCVEHLFRYVIVGHLNGNLRSSGRVELAKHYTLDVVIIVVGGFDVDG